MQNLTLNLSTAEVKGESVELTASGAWSAKNEYHLALPVAKAEELLGVPALKERIAELEAKVLALETALTEALKPKEVEPS